MRRRVPKRWDDLTPEWMTAALAAEHPGARVGEISVVARDDGTNRRARLGLSYAAGSGPGTVFVKAHNDAHRIVHLRNGNLFGEARLFGSGVTLPLEHPVVYRAVVDRPHLDFLIVMEDLKARGADPRDSTRPMTTEQVANGLRGLARMHGAYWGLSRATRPGLRWVKTWKPTKGWQVGLRKRVPAGLERAADRLPQEVGRLDADGLVDLWVRYVETLTDGPMTLLHGDTHIGNTYVLPDGEVGFLDWQVVRRGNWSHDVGHFLIGALPEEDRRDAETGLVEEYRRSLEAAGAAGPSAEEAWLRYRASAVYGLVIWLSTLGSAGYQRPEVSLALVERFSAAYAELEAEDALARLRSGGA
ncbi:phosphotransferase [Actinomadura rugatobispora]|uniref:Phosphotransferase n=1 Tax=Actinomadura rugatobispora TaxID=1994 RepID=A0ABW1AB17_9ACTN|nr:phosphotransferase [Actinomadura rugatobispora]